MDIPTNKPKDIGRLADDVLFMFLFRCRSKGVAIGGELIHADEAFRVQGAVFEVSRTLGVGFLEAVYQECLALEFAARGIPFRAMPRLSLAYKGTTLTQTYAPDFICFDKIIVELKSAREQAPEHRAQVLNYLRVTGLDLGLLVNFGSSRATVQRLALSDFNRERTQTDANAPA